LYKEKYKRVEDKMTEEEKQTNENKETGKRKSTLPQFKVFDKYEVFEIQVNDPGLKEVINLEPKLVVESHGRSNTERFGKEKINVIERLANKLSTAGHRGKKHKIEKGEITSKKTKINKIILEAFRIIEKQTGKNPVEVLVRAIEKSAPRDEVTVIEYGGARYPQAVDVSPMRRINVALRHIAHGSSDKAFNKKKTFAQALAEELKMASEENAESFAVKKRREAEAQADSAR